MKQPRRSQSTFGFARAATLVQSRIRTASESRGFAETRLLTHWAEIVGPAVAAVARPVSVGYGKGGFGATLTLLTSGAQAPMLEMQKEQIREKVNACYGYRAISRVRVTQTAPSGFAEGRIAFDHAPAPERAPDPATVAAAAETTCDVADDGLRLALQALATNVLSRSKH